MAFALEGRGAGIFVFGAFFWVINIAIMAALISVVANIYYRIITLINLNAC